LSNQFKKRSDHSHKKMKENTRKQIDSL
jgi:hypothetical protein